MWQMQTLVNDVNLIKSGFEAAKNGAEIPLGFYPALDRTKEYYEYPEGHKPRFNYSRMISSIYENLSDKTLRDLWVKSGKEADKFARKAATEELANEDIRRIRNVEWFVDSNEQSLALLKREAEPLLGIYREEIRNGMTDAEAQKNTKEKYAEAQKHTPEVMREEVLMRPGLTIPDVVREKGGAEAVKQLEKIREGFIDAALAETQKMQLTPNQGELSLTQQTAQLKQLYEGVDPNYAEMHTARDVERMARHC